MLIEIVFGLAIVAVLIGFLVEAYDGVERLAIIFFGGIFGFLAWFAICITLSFFVSRPMEKTFITVDKPLATLRDGTQTEGQFFLGFGSIEGVQKYTYYVQEGKGKKLENADADTVTVYEDSDKPYLVQQTDCKTSMEWLAFCLTDKRVTEIHVPANTIKQDFVLDAE